MPLEGPPPDPEDWTAEQWIEWLEATDAGDDGAVAPPVTALGRIARSPGGSALGQAMLGMAAAIYGRADREVAIVAEGSSEPEEDKAFAVHLDPEHPEQSVVVFRRRQPDHPTGGHGGEGPG